MGDWYAHLIMVKERTVSPTESPKQALKLMISLAIRLENKLKTPKVLMSTLGMILAFCLIISLSEGIKPFLLGDFSQKPDGLFVGFFTFFQLDGVKGRGVRD